MNDWCLTPAEAIALQKQLAGNVRRESPGKLAPRLVAGADIAVGRRGGLATGAVVVLSYPELRLVESKTLTGQLEFPYIPGLLSFREIPLLLRIFETLATSPDLVFVDGQGVAHPRRLGIAAHLGLCLDVPTIGCAKSLLCGEYAEPGIEAGESSDILDKGEVIGAAVRTATAVKPVFVSIGNRIDLASAVDWVLKCCRGYRLPEPARLAHQAAGGNLQAATSREPAIN